MDLLSVSPWGMVAAVLASVIIGSLWFSPLLFVKPWMEGLGLPAKEVAKGPHWTTWVVMLLAEIAMAFMISALRIMTGITSVTETLTLVIIIYVAAFGLPTLMNALFGKKNLTVWCIEAGYMLTVLVAQGLVLSFL